jgi:hypothetical protein
MSSAAFDPRRIEFPGEQRMTKSPEESGSSSSSSAYDSFNETIDKLTMTQSAEVNFKFVKLTKEAYREEWLSKIGMPSVFHNCMPDVWWRCFISVHVDNSGFIHSAQGDGIDRKTAREDACRVVVKSSILRGPVPRDMYIDQ